MSEVKDEFIGWLRGKIYEQQNKIDYLERKLELCRKQRNKLIGNTLRKAIEDEFDEELEDLK